MTYLMSSPTQAVITNSTLVIEHLINKKTNIVLSFRNVMAIIF